MSSNPNNTPTKRADGARMNYTAAESVRVAQFHWRELAKLVAPAENVKGQYRAVEKATGIAPRRQKDIRGGYLNLIHDHEALRLRVALQKARSALVRFADQQREIAQASMDEYDRLVAERTILERQFDLDL